jgi:sporulation protein YlmC with PRC-barrel domain
MRLSDLLGARVTDADGTTLGEVIDVRLAQIGRPHLAMAELEVESLVVSPRATGSLFGYDRRADQGPLLLRAIIRFLHRHAFIVDWRDVDWSPDSRHVTLTRNAGRRGCHPA